MWRVPVISGRHANCTQRGTAIREKMPHPRTLSGAGPCWRNTLPVLAIFSHRARPRQPWHLRGRRVARECLILSCPAVSRRVSLSHTVSAAHRLSARAALPGSRPRQPGPIATSRPMIVLSGLARRNPCIEPGGGCRVRYRYGTERDKRQSDPQAQEIVTRNN